MKGNGKMGSSMGKEATSQSMDKGLKDCGKTGKKFNGMNNRYCWIKHIN